MDYMYKLQYTTYSAVYNESNCTFFFTNYVETVHNVQRKY